MVKVLVPSAEFHEETSSSTVAAKTAAAMSLGFALS